MEEFGDVVVGLDLRGAGVESQAEAGDELPRHPGPVHVRIGHRVGVVVAHRAVHLAAQLGAQDRVTLAFQARHRVGDLLAHGGGRRRLAVGARQHGHVGERQGELAQRRDEALRRRRQRALACLAQHQGVGEVVDVLRGAAEVDELDVSGQAVDAPHGVLDEVLDRLHVVVGLRFDGANGSGVGHVEALPQGAQRVLLAGVRGRQLGHRVELGEMQEPLHLDAHPIAH